MEGDTDNSVGDEAPLIEDSTKAQEFKNSGNEKFKNNNYKGAVADYKKGLLYEPNNPELHANLAASFIHLERFIDAEEHAVFAIHLRPTFYKGYMRAAKAAHGKYMTKLALKHLEEGLSKVTEIIGVRELNRLKTQYEAFLSLPSNIEREMDWDPDFYQSEEDDFSYSSEGSEGNKEDKDKNPPPVAMAVAAAPVETEPIKKETPEPIKPVVKDEEPPTDQVPQPSVDTKPEPEMPPIQRKKNIEKEVDKPPVKEPDRFLEMCKELSKDPELKKKIEDFKGQLRVAGEAYLAGNYRRAAEYYRAAKDRVGLRFSDYEIDERQLQVIKYAYCAALISIGTYDELVRAIQALAEMKTFEFSIPAMYIQMARAYYKLNRFKNALEPLDKAQRIIDNCPIFDTFTWPGTTETIQETTPVGIKNAIKELKQLCKMSHKPTAVCRLDTCLRNSTHIVPSELIYFSDPDFVGFVRMVCEEKCHIEFHISCWKSYKELISGVEKINDKEMLGRHCLTTDCVSYDGEPSIVTTIEIFGPDGEVKSTIKLDPKSATDSKNSKKKKTKEKDEIKVPKPKKPKEKKIREEKKRLTLAVDGEETPSDQVKDSKKALEARLESLAQLRSINFGFDKTWNPQMPFYGLEEEAVKWSKETPSHLTNSQDSVEVRDAKEFIFSYFMPILKEQGPLKQSDVDDLWKESAGDFCDITVVLPNLKSISELLNESTCFCLLEDYICLAEQMEAAYDLVKTEVSETVAFLMTGSTQASSASETNPNLPDVIHPQKSNTTFQSSSEEDSEDSSDEESESEEEAEGEESVSDEEDQTRAISESPETVQDSSGDVFETPCGDMGDDFVIPPSKPIDDNNFDDEKFSLQKMLSQIKNTMMKGSEETTTSEYPEVSMRVESPGDEGFFTPLNQTISSPEDANQTEENFEEEVKLEEKEETEPINDGKEVVVTPSELEINGEVVENSPTEISMFNKESGNNSMQDRDKASQSDTLLTEERQIQTTRLEMKDSLSQTKDCDLFKELVKKVQELNLKLGFMTKKNEMLNTQLAEESAIYNSAHRAFDKTILQLHEENRKSGKALQDTKAELAKKEHAFKQKEENLQKNLKKREEMYSNLHNDHLKLKKSVEGLTKEKEEVKKKLHAALQNAQQFDANYRQLEEQMKNNMQQMQKNQLATIKSFWESQINLLRKRCVEKISEMQSWFSMFPSEEVEDLPSWNLIKHNIIQWGEVSKKVHTIEANFLKTYSSLENRIQAGEEVDLTQVLPALPEEPTPLPLDKIHQEIMAKHLKKIVELNSLVVSQQMEIAKSKEANQQIHQLVNSLQMGGGPRHQSPMTTAFGSLALQYPYPHQPLPVPTVPPNQDGGKSGIAAKLLQADVQMLLQESSNAVTFTGASQKAVNRGEEATAPGQRPPMVSIYKSLDSLKELPPPNMPAPTTMPPPNMPPLNMPLPVNMPPPPMGVAQNLLKTSSVLADKKDKPQPVRERSLTPVAKAPSSSRETTPIPSSTATPSPTPEKVKKKKKKADAAAAAALTVEVKMNDVFQKEDDWNIVLPKNAVNKHIVTTSLGIVENKLKNKKKLLDKLQLKYPSSSLKDLDDIVKLVREQNNGSLSGLPFDEIETRVDRFITKRHFQKSSTMGLDKFTAAAWAPVKQQENPTWSNLGLEDCSICLDPMGSEQPHTKFECKHEFHTKCIREWLKEQRTCPLCKKFTTMPDEFPAL